MRSRKVWVAGSIAVAASLTLAACGSSSSGGSTPNGGSSSATGTTGGTLKVLTGTYPDGLDPQFSYTTQGLEADNMVYTPLLTYQYKEGTQGTVLQPGLATALPTVSPDQLTYSLTLRSGLKYSDGSPVLASDFTHGIERAIRIPWGGSSFYTGYIKGAEAFAKKTSNTISGIVTNNSTGAITIHLTQPYGAFDNLLAFASASPVPANTPYKDEEAHPPIGIGPYKFGKIVPNASYVLVKNPNFAGFKIPNIPTGYVNQVDVNVASNTQTEAQQVLDNQADIFDPGDTLPASLLSSVEQQTSRYSKEPIASVYYFFLNSAVPPFNKLAVRTAVNMALDRTALSRLSSGSLTPGCYFLPPTIVGHNDGSCAFGGAGTPTDPSVVPSSATVAKAKSMIAAAGDAGDHVTVWSQLREPRTQFGQYYADLLNKIGLKATIKPIADADYFPTIGNHSLQAQTGFADWSQDFPNPSDFYLLLSKAGIQAQNSENFGNVDDSNIESQLARLNPTPASQLSSVATDWQNLDKYTVSKSYMAPFGYETVPKFTSDRVNFANTVFHPVNYIEYNTVQLK